MYTTPKCIRNSAIQTKNSEWVDSRDKISHATLILSLLIYIQKMFPFA